MKTKQKLKSGKGGVNKAMICLFRLWETGLLTIWHPCHSSERLFLVK